MKIYYEIDEKTHSEINEFLGRIRSLDVNGTVKHLTADEFVYWAIACQLDAYWNAEEEYMDIFFKGQPEEQLGGYQWKEVFLPNGAQLRMKYMGKLYEVSVAGDVLEFEGEKGLSPSQIANKVTSSSRNAWRDFEILRNPNEPEAKWVPAQRLRDMELEQSKKRKKEYLDLSDF